MASRGGKEMSEEKVKKLEEVYKKIFEAISGLTNGEAIVQLELAKVDIILNDKLVVLDGKSGKIVKPEDIKSEEQ